MADSEMVDVVVSAEHRIFYRQNRKIPKALFDQYEAMCEAGAKDSEFDRTFEGLIDTTDVYDANDLEDVTIEAAVT